MIVTVTVEMTTVVRDGTRFQITEFGIRYIVHTTTPVGRSGAFNVLPVLLAQWTGRWHPERPMRWRKMTPTLMSEGGLY